MTLGGTKPEWMLGMEAPIEWKLTTFTRVLLGYWYIGHGKLTWGIRPSEGPRVWGSGPLGDLDFQDFLLTLGGIKPEWMLGMEAPIVLKLTLFRKPCKVRRELVAHSWICDP